jgi:hypothetical protein
VDGIYRPHVPPPEVLHHRRDCTGFHGRRQQVNMVAHQDIGMDRAAATARRLCKALQKEPPVDIAEKASRTVVAPLDDMQRNSRKLDTG